MLATTSYHALNLPLAREQHRQTGQRLPCLAPTGDSIESSHFCLLITSYGSL
jgi:hypothetical protein